MPCHLPRPAFSLTQDSRMTVATLPRLTLPMCLRHLTCSPLPSSQSSTSTELYKSLYASWHSHKHCSLADLPRILTTQIQDVLTQICASTELVVGEAKQNKNTYMLQVNDQAKFSSAKIRTIFFASFGLGSFPRILI